MFDCLPLALRQISVFIIESRITIGKLWSLLREKPEAEVNLHSHVDESTGYVYTTSNVWDTVLAHLDLESSKLLNIMALLDPDGIPDELFAPSPNGNGVPQPDMIPLDQIG